MRRATGVGTQTTLAVIRALRMRVLVVEDEPVIRELAANELRDAGFEVLEAATGEEVLRFCDEQPP